MSILKNEGHDPQGLGNKPVGAERYWEARWRDEKAENDRLRSALQKIASLEVTMGAAANLAEQVLSETETP